jgi:hypothetical protein
MIRRRSFTAGVAALLAAPSIARGAANAALKFIPQSDLTILDPIVTTVYTARNHASPRSVAGRRATASAHCSWRAPTN